MQCLRTPVSVLRATQVNALTFRTFVPFQSLCPSLVQCLAFKHALPLDARLISQGTGIRAKQSQPTVHEHVQVLCAAVAIAIATLTNARRRHA